MKHSDSKFARCIAISIIAAVVAVVRANATPSLGLETNIVTESAAPGDFPLLRDKLSAPLFLDSADFPGVLRAASDLQADIERVSQIKPALITQGAPAGKAVVIAGTLGKSPLIDGLVESGKLNADPITGKWESFIITTITNPLPGINQALVIAGSDKRGTIYGLYEISEQIGVSPWYWWADVPAKHHDALFIKAGTYVQGPPSVKYRGIFINDEAPDLTGWIRKNFGTVPGHPGAANYGRGFYTNLFEVMLRLRANYLWPAMWSNAFNEDDPENPRLADEYGIVMGTSHQEPMLRSQQEWDHGLGKKYGNWNYNNTNQQPVLQQFWREGVRRNRNYESIITMGLRAENDSAMELGKDLTETVIGVQRKILAEEVNSDLPRVPQLWCLYKEVMGYYNEGLRAPDDVTLLWAEDNWGNVRRLPSAEERQRGGGAGVYYHLDYHGAPRNYQWLNSSPISKVWDQMSLAKQYGADRIWIVNVGHFKGCEFPLEFFMRFAWDTPRWTNDQLDEYTRLWVGQQFGSGTGVPPVRSNNTRTHGQDARATTAAEIADILTAYSRFNGRRKPELLAPDTYSLVNYGEFEKVVADYEALAAKAEKISDELPAESRDAFYELVLFPTKASAGLNAMYLAAAKNALYARQGRADANDFAAQTRELFQAQTNLMAYFNHTFAGGKWNHFMDQTYIGYTNWDGPKQNNLRTVPLAEIEVPDAAAMGVAVDGSEIAMTNGEISLPPFDAFNQQRRCVEVFNRGKAGFAFTASASAPWIHIAGSSRGDEAQTKESEHKSETPYVVSCEIEKQQRLWISVDWTKVQTGTNAGEIKIAGAGGTVSVKIVAFNPSEPTRESLQGFVESDGCVSIEAEHFTKNLDAVSNRWIRIPDYGHTLSAMRATGPDYIEAMPGKDSPCLEYKLYLFSTGKVEVESTVGATLNFLPGRPLRYAVSFDEQTPEVITIVPAIYDAHWSNDDWSDSVKNNCRHVKSTHTIAAPGYHTLKIWMVDPAVAVEKIVINTGGVRPSYLGPPESFHR